MAAAYAPDFHQGGEPPLIPMDTDNEHSSPGKRKNGNTKTIIPDNKQDSMMDDPEQEHQANKKNQNKHNDHEPEKKKRYSGNGIRRSKTLVRMDFPNAKNRKDAHSQWIQVFSMIKK